MRPPISTAKLLSRARRPASKRANHSAMRRKRGHQKARASGKAVSGLKCSSPISVIIRAASAGS